MRNFFLISAAATLICAPLAAQIAVPGVRLPDPGVVTGPVLDTLERTTAEATRLASELARDRLRRIERLVRANRDTIELDAAGHPARRGELLVMDADAALLGQVSDAGFRLLDREEVEGLDLAVLRFAIPEQMTLAEAQAVLATLLPSADISADTLHFQSGAVVSAGRAATASAVKGGRSTASVGMIDGAPAPQEYVSAKRGFAQGAPVASNHGSAVASLLASAGVRDIRVADVYGTDKAGGNALAIARGLGWLVANGSDVVTISLVGPRNGVLERAVAAAQDRGVVIVAAVGNDGPAAPPSFPASYDGVVAVTAVDGRRRALIEAGRALHLDYAAPGADIRGLNAKGKRIRLRGTSFATPLVAARVARHLHSGTNWRDALDKEAVDLGTKGDDPVYGRGLVCGSCRGH